VEGRKVKEYVYQTFSVSNHHLILVEGFENTCHLLLNWLFPNVTEYSPQKPEKDVIISDDLVLNSDVNLLVEMKHSEEYGIRVSIELQGRNVEGNLCMLRKAVSLKILVDFCILNFVQFT